LKFGSRPPSLPGKLLVKLFIKKNESEMNVKKKERKKKRKKPRSNDKLPLAISDATAGTILPEYESPAM